MKRFIEIETRKRSFKQAVRERDEKSILKTPRSRSFSKKGHMVNGSFNDSTATIAQVEIFVGSQLQSLSQAPNYTQYQPMQSEIEFMRAQLQSYQQDRKQDQQFLQSQMQHYQQQQPDAATVRAALYESVIFNGG